MGIQSITVYATRLDLRVPFTTSFGTQTYFRRPYVIVKTDDGLTGIGEVATMNQPAYKAENDTPSALTSLSEFLVPSVFKHQADHGPIETIEQLNQSYAWVKGAVFAKAGIETALWDIEAQRAQVPLWKLWGGTQRSFPVGVSIGGKTLEQVLQLADNAASLGYKRFKVKIWPGFDYDVAVALRERFPTILLQVDANSAYDRTNWSDLKRLDEFDLLLIEQPLYDDDIVMHSEIAREIKTPICLDECIHSIRDVEAAVGLWQRNEVIERLIINIKPARVSGFAESIEIANYCRRVGVRTWVGGMLESAWGKAFNLAFNALDAIDLPGDHFSPSGAYFQRDLAGPALSAPDGEFTLGDGVSTGLEFDWDAFNAMSELVLEQKSA